jgi:hypothetical protein
MATTSYYRAEAERCRDLAEIAADPEISRRWHRLADEYAVLAEELAAAEGGRKAILRTPIKPQLQLQQLPQLQQLLPQQQQQQPHTLQK